jgi:hypothetical protein
MYCLTAFPDLVGFSNNRKAEAGCCHVGRGGLAVTSGLALSHDMTQTAMGPNKPEKGKALDQSW